MNPLLWFCLSGVIQSDKAFGLEKMEIEKLHVPNTGVISRLQRAWGVIQPNEASCSSESSLPWLQMGQLGDDEKLWEGGPKLCLCIWLNFLWDNWTPAIQFYTKTCSISRSWRRRMVVNKAARQQRKFKTRRLTHNTQSGLGSLLNIEGHSNLY